MALIKVGIHENLMLTAKTVINEHGTLELGVKTVEDPNALINAFENNTTFDEMESSFRFYPPSIKDFSQNVKSSAELAADLLKMRHQFMQYALLFGTKEEVNKAIGGLSMFAGTGQEDPGKAIAQLVQESYLKKVSENLAVKFVKFLKEKKAFDGSITFRQKFLRQSEAKNFATIPSSTFDVWIEPMTIPKKSSKIAYSDWEIKNKKDNPDPIASTQSESTPVDVKKANALFKKSKDEVKAPNLD